MSQTLHVRGAVLPDGSECDLFIRDGDVGLAAWLPAAAERP